MSAELKHFAVIDPANPGRMTYWRRTPHDQLAPWPPRARPEPRLLKRDVPAGLAGPDRAAWVRAWFDANVAPWWKAIYAAVDADPNGCAARFAALTSRCCACGRELTDAASKTYGIGPDCRDRATPDLLAWFADAVGRAHASALIRAGAVDLPLRGGEEGPAAEGSAAGPATAVCPRLGVSPTPGRATNVRSPAPTAGFPAGGRTPTPRAAKPSGARPVSTRAARGHPPDR